MNEDVTALPARLLERREEVKHAMLERVRAIADPTEVADPEYADGLRVAVSVAFEYGVEALTQSGGRWPPFPAALLSQARLAARSGVKLDTVMRRYLAGYSLFSDFLLDELERDDHLDRDSLKRLFAVQTSLVDHLIATVAAEYTSERERLSRTAEQRRADVVERLLAGVPVDDATLGYNLDAWHLAVVVYGAEAVAGLRAAAKGWPGQSLVVARADQTAWGWLGSYAQEDLDAYGPTLLSAASETLALALGEPARGLAGWRFSHRQAATALAVARRRTPMRARYRDDVLVAAALEDDLVAASLRRLYLAPIESERDGGQAARETICAFFESDHNLSSAAARLGVSRQTVSNRLRAVERLLGRTLTECSGVLEAALQLDRLGDPRI